MSRAYQILKRPLVTEKSSALKAEANKVAFEVSRDANKAEIKSAMKELFDIEVRDVRTMIIRGKQKRVGKSIGRRKTWKKAIVTLKDGADLDVFGHLDMPTAPPEGDE
jgi:large subunit ribosomal protein L23